MRRARLTRGAWLAFACLAATGAQAGTVSYSYDALGRVTSSADTDGTVITYSYDAAGNVTQSVVTSGVNHAPTANGDAVSTNENTAVTFYPLANDQDLDGDGLTINSRSAPAHGTLSIASSNGLTYTPATNYYGSDSFTYNAADGRGGISNTATVNITIQNTNHSPVANGDTLSTLVNTAKTINPLVNDTDADGDSLTISGTANGTHGTTAYTANSVTYTPAVNYTGSDAFTYTVSDGRGGVATGTVAVSVAAPNQAPTANTDSMNITVYHAPGTTVRPAKTMDPRTNDSDPDGDTLTITSVTNGAKGTVSIGVGGASVTYVYNTTVLTNLSTTDSFTYTISDGMGHTATATVLVTIYVEVSSSQ